MRCVRVQYDAYNRHFNLIDRELAADLEDGNTYLLADLSTQDFLPANELELEADDMLN